MNRPTHVRKRDGRVVPFDEGKIADAIYRAALAAGGEDRFLAEELAGMVTLFLVKTLPVEPPSAPAGIALPGLERALYGAADGAVAGDGDPFLPVPSIEQIQDMVEKVLVETGHARTAKTYILHRERRTRLREAAAARLAEDPPSLFDDRLLLVEDASAERSAPFSADRLARVVSAEAGLAPEEARAVARGVEERLRRARLRRVPAPLVSSLVDAELLETGRLGEPRRRSGALLPREAIDAALAPKARPGAALPPEAAARRLGGEVLRSHALTEVFPAEVAAAHLEGALHIHGLSRPAALFSLTLGLDALKVEGVPGAGGRAPARASEGMRRFLAQTGRAVRTLRGYATHGVGVPAANLLLAPLLPGLAGEDPDPGDLREEAWHLLFETAADADGAPSAMATDLDLLAEVPAVFASVPALGSGGRRTGEHLGDHSGRSLALARAVVAVRASGEGLPPRAALPGLNLVVGRSGLGDPRSRVLLRESLGAALRGTPVRLVLERDGIPFVGSLVARRRLEDAGPLAAAGTLRPFCAQRVTINLPRAAFRCPPGDLSGFFRECDRLVDLAVEAHRARRSLLATVAAGEGGVLTPLFQRRRSEGGPPPVDLSSGTWSVGIIGLNETVSHLLGEEFHESDAAVKVGCRILAYLDLKVRESGAAADLQVHLDASSPGRAAGRLAALDRSEYRREQEEATAGRGGYSEGASLRAGAPADLLLRLEREGRLHGHLGTGVFRFDPSGEPGVSEEGLLAAVEKAFLHTEVRQIAFEPGSGAPARAALRAAGAGAVPRRGGDTPGDEGGDGGGSH